MLKPLASLEKKLNYQFNKSALLIQGLTHRSFGRPHNERMEFLGDAILDLIISEALYVKYDFLPEGQLSRLRAALVNQDTLSNIAKKMSLYEYVIVGKGELKSGVFSRASLLSDTLEALVAAIYLDSNLQTCREKILPWFSEWFEKVTPTVDLRDDKTRLQEYVQANHYPLPEYIIMRDEEVGGKTLFFVECRIMGIDYIAYGQGLGRREAEKKAAHDFLEWFMENNKHAKR